MKKHLLLACLVPFIAVSVMAQSANKKPAVAATQCVEKESKPNKDGDVTITRTCTFQNYRSVCIGEPDYKGRTFWSSTLFLKKDGRFVKVTNADFFNKNGDKLLAMLNKQFNKNFLADKAAVTDSDTKECFSDKTKLDWYKWEDISIELKDDSLVFSISYGLGSACLSQDDGGTSLTFQNLKPYLKP